MEYIKRDIEENISKFMYKKEIIAIVGVRQCGKTTVINHILDKLEKKGKKVKRITFDNIKDLELFEQDIESFIELYVKNFDFLFIDEVHYSKNSGKKLKYVYDNFDIKIFISGSSAAEISIHSLKYLVGRIFTFTLYPFSFREFIRAKNPKILNLYESGKYKSEIILKFNKYIKEFIIYGGYPRVVLTDDKEEKKTVLKNIYNTYLLKEIKEILDLSEDFRLIKLLKSLSLQIGNILNYNELSSLTGFSYNDLKKYLNILEKTYICSLIRPFYTNKRVELVKSPKIFFFDSGFRNICIDNFSQERSDLGSLYENYIFSELIKENIFPKYWRTKSKAEVDFIIEKENKVTPIEIKSNLKQPKLTKSFHSFLEKYNPKKSYILSSDFEGSKKLKNYKITFLPFSKFNQLSKEL